LDDPISKPTFQVVFGSYRIASANFSCDIQKAESKAITITTWDQDRTCHSADLLPVGITLEKRQARREFAELRFNSFIVMKLNLRL